VWLSLWQECYEFCLPENALFTGAQASINRSHVNLYDGTAVDAVDQLAASLLGQLTPPWVNWLGLMPGPEVQGTARADLTAILDQAAAVMQEQIDRSALYTELHQCFLDVVVGGTACLRMARAAPGAPVRLLFEAVPLHEVILGAGPGGAFTSLFRPRQVTGAELEALGITVPEKTDKAAALTILEYSVPAVVGGVEVGVIDMTTADQPVILTNSIRATSPYIVFRWQKTPGSAFGRSPVMKALPDIKTANKVVELVLKNASIAATGIWQADDDGVLNVDNIDLSPGVIIPKAVGSAGLKPLEMPGRFDVSQLVLDDLRARIRHALLVDRFAQIERRPMTATEVLARGQDTALILGAIYGRLHTELVTPLLTQVYDLLRDEGMVPDLPLDGQIVQLVDRSPMSRRKVSWGWHR
jgi:hypothetical protein